MSTEERVELVAVVTEMLEEDWAYPVSVQAKRIAGFIEVSRKAHLNAQLDRLEAENPDINYHEPSNCRWATMSEQNHNRRPRNNTGIVGVKLKPWGYEVRVTKDGIHHYGGIHKNIEDAREAQRRLSEKVYGVPVAVKPKEQLTALNKLFGRDT